VRRRRPQREHDPEQNAGNPQRRAWGSTHPGLGCAPGPGAGCRKGGESI